MGARSYGGHDGARWNLSWGVSLGSVLRILVRVVDVFRVLNRSSYPAFFWQAVRSDLWLASNPLASATVLDYFALSHFYNPNCINELAATAGRSRADSG